MRGVDGDVAVIDVSNVSHQRRHIACGTTTHPGTYAPRNNTLNLIVGVMIVDADAVYDGVRQELAVGVAFANADAALSLSFVVVEPPVRVSYTVAPATVEARDRVTVVRHVANTGTATAYNLSFTEALPADGSLELAGDATQHPQSTGVAGGSFVYAVLHPGDSLRHVFDLDVASDVEAGAALDFATDVQYYSALGGNVSGRIYSETTRATVLVRNVSGSVAAVPLGDYVRWSPATAVAGEVGEIISKRSHRFCVSHYAMYTFGNFSGGACRRPRVHSAWHSLQPCSGGDVVKRRLFGRD